MSDDMTISQPLPRSPEADFQSKKTGTCRLNQSSKAKSPHESVAGDRKNFFSILKRVTQDRIFNLRSKFAPDESWPMRNAPFEAREMDSASPDQIPTDWKFTPVIRDLENLGILAGNNHKGLMDTSGRQPEKAARTTSLPKDQDSEAGQRILRYQIADQIIRRAATHLRNGRYEAIIDLKSDFLGRIRMQVISENQQVTVRILAEQGYVKEMIESNLHQLKADLHQRGLEIEKLDVTIARDPHDSGNTREKFAQRRIRPDKADLQINGNQEDKQQKDARPASQALKSIPTVDYFA